MSIEVDHVWIHQRTAEDDAFVEALFRENRAPEFLPLQLPPHALNELLAMQYRAQSTSFARQFPGADDAIVGLGEQRVGRLLVNRSPDCLHLVDIAIAAPFRGRGLGTVLLKKLITEAANTGVSLQLHVRPGNPAARLYLRLGFKPVGGDGVDLKMELQPREREVDRAKTSSVARQEPACVDPEPGATSGYFRSLVGKTFHARVAEGASLEFVLESVRTLDNFGAADIEVGDSFVLSFLAPWQAQVAAATYIVADPKGARFEIFLSPVARRNHLVELEAVFNRSSMRSTSSA